MTNGEYTPVDPVAEMVGRRSRAGVRPPRRIRDGAGTLAVVGVPMHLPDMSMLQSLRGRVEPLVAGGTWWARAPLLIVLAWVLHRHLDDPAYTSILGGVNLGFHEMGHAAFMWFGNRMLTTAGGTIFEVGIPFVAGGYLLVKQRDPFGAAFCLFWAGTALVGTGAYAADARAQQLPLVSPFGPVDVDSHDWTVMLLKVGRLSQDQAIGGMLRGAGLVAMSGGLLSGAWILRVMATTPSGSYPEAEKRAA